MYFNIHQTNRQILKMSVLDKCVSFENVQLENGVVSVPEDMCEQEGVFCDVFSLETLTNELSKQQQDSLMAFLPSFPENDEEEKIKTLQSLFSGENFRFGNPLEQFFKKLNQGFFNPEVAELSKNLKSIAYEQYKCQQKKHFCKLLKDVVISKKFLLEASSKSCPNEHVKIENVRSKASEMAKERAKWRYFMELQEVREECGEMETSSEDENYPGPPPKLPRKQKKQMLEGALSPDIVRVTSTTSAPSGPLGSSSASLTLAMFEMTDERYRQMLLRHQQRRASGEIHPGLDTSSVTLEGIMSRTALAKRSLSKSEGSSKKKIKTEPVEKKPKPNHTISSSNNGQSAAGNSTTSTSCSKESAVTLPAASTPGARSLSPCIQSFMDVKAAIPPVSIAVSQIQPHPVPEDVKLLVPKLEPQEDFEVDVGSDVEGQTPIIRPSLPDPEPQQQSPPLNFFALLRDLFYELPEQKMSMVRLEERVRLWMDSPMAVCAEWLNMHDTWVELVSSALRFLAGDLLGILPENFVPYVDYREKQQHWQWIGAGRDTDEHLVALCQHWLLSKDNLALEALEACQGSPPPPRVATDWTVRPSSGEEKTSYRDQECVRYQNPHRAFTFRIHGYESVVGPVKGVYGKESGVNKAREHSLLVSDRPPFVTILSLVRDAAARLPNGEGTRADICELLKDSQYLAPANDQQIHTVVSGALDRLHYEKDPCVKYDVNRKLWIYLHRHRTEEEFERIHQAQAAAAKAKKAMQKSKPPRTKSKDSRPESTVSEALGSCASLPGNLSATQNTPNKPAASPKSAKQNSRRLSLPSQSPKGSSSPHHRDSISPSTAASSKANSLASLFSQQQQQQAQNAGETSRPSSQGSLPSPKAVIANVNATQLLNVPQLQASNPSPSSTPTPPPLTVNMTPSSPAFVGQPPVLQPVISGATVTSPSLSKPVTVKRTVAQSPLQGFQTIVIKQEPVTKPSVTASLPILGRSPGMGSKPVMARLVSGTQVVSLGNLVGGTVSNSGTIKPLTAAALRMQGTSYIRPTAGPTAGPTAINMLHAGARLPKFAVVSQSSAVHPGVASGLKLSPEQQERIMSPSSTMNLVASSQAGQAALGHLSGAKQHGLITTNAQGQSMVAMTTGSNLSAGVLLAGNNPVVIATQAALKPSTQTYVMTGPGTQSTVVMAAGQHNVRSAPLNVKTLQSIKVIPVSQTVGTIRNKTQPLLARIITPQAGLTLRPTGAGPSGTQTSMGLVQTTVQHAGMSKAQTLSLPVGGNQSVIVQVHAPTLVNPEDVK